MKKKRHKIRVGVVGLGRIGWLYHCATLADNKHYDLVAVVDPLKDRRREAEAELGVTAYTHHQDMFRKADIELAIIASPTHLHLKQAVLALQSGLHVYVEKPMALDAKESKAMARAAQRSGHVLSVYQPHRAHAYFRHMKHIAESGRLGQIYHIRRSLTNCVRRNDWQSLRKYGGGMLLNYGTHAMDQMLDLTGHDVCKVFCNLRVVASMGDAEDVVKILYETRSGMLGEIDINQVCPHSPNMMEIYGTHGVAILDKHDTITTRTFSPTAFRPKKLNTSLASTNREYPGDKVNVRQRTIGVDKRHDVDLYANLAHAIRAGSQLLVPPADSIAVMELLDKCRKNARVIHETRI